MARNLYVKGTRVRACTQHILYQENIQVHSISAVVSHLRHRKERDTDRKNVVSCSNERHTQRMCLITDECPSHLFIKNNCRLRVFFVNVLMGAPQRENQSTTFCVDSKTSESILNEISCVKTMAVFREKGASHETGADNFGQIVSCSASAGCDDRVPRSCVILRYEQRERQVQ